jgi:hypothetical protein
MARSFSPSQATVPARVRHAGALAEGAWESAFARSRAAELSAPSGAPAPVERAPGGKGQQSQRNQGHQQQWKQELAKAGLEKLAKRSLCGSGQPVDGDGDAQQDPEQDAGLGRPRRVDGAGGEVGD